MLDIARPNPDLREVLLLTPARHGDARGWFSETYNARALSEAGVDCAFVQDNQSFSADAGTVRGLHFQAPPHAQNKLVRVLRGSIIDVAVDIRRNSPTFGAHVRVELSAETGAQLFVPAGFAHGFATLTPDVEIFYKVDAYYDRGSEGAILWNDPALGVDWMIDPARAKLSRRDAAAPLLGDIESPFD